MSLAAVGWRRQGRPAHVVPLRRAVLLLEVSQFERLEREAKASNCSISEAARRALAREASR